MLLSVRGAIETTTNIALLVVEVFHAQQYFVFLHAKLRQVAHRQKHRMLFIARTNAISHSLGLQHIFLAENIMSLFAVAALGHAALNGIHLQEFSGLVCLGILGVSR